MAALPLRLLTLFGGVFGACSFVSCGDFGLDIFTDCGVSILRLVTRFTGDCFGFTGDFSTVFVGLITSFATGVVFVLAPLVFRFVFGEGVFMPFRALGLTNFGELLVDVLLGLFDSVFFLLLERCLGDGVFSKVVRPSYDGDFVFLGVVSSRLIPAKRGVLADFGDAISSFIPVMLGVLVSLGVRSICFIPPNRGLLLSFGVLNIVLMPLISGLAISFGVAIICLIPASLGDF